MGFKPIFLLAEERLRQMREDFGVVAVSRNDPEINLVVRSEPSSSLAWGRLWRWLLADAGPRSSTVREQED